VAAVRANASGAAALFAELAVHVDRLYPFAAIAVAVRPATTVALDAEGQAARRGGDSARLGGWHAHLCLALRLVSPEVLDRDRPITRRRIDRKMDPDRRWVLIERHGLGSYLVEAGAAEIQRDDCGQLHRLARRLGDPILAVRVMNHTPEPDGSVREFWLPVPPTMATARQGRCLDLQSAR
jgi:hypothetical protein